MNLLKRLFARDADPKPALRPLWHRTVELSRDPAWYANRGVADTVQGLATLTVFGRQHRAAASIEAVTDRYRRETMKVLRVSSARSTTRTDSSRYWRSSVSREGRSVAHTSHVGDVNATSVSSWSS